MENNFICKNCKKQFFEANYSISVTGSYTYKGQFIRCPQCQSSDIESIPKKGGFNINLGKFSMLSPLQKQESLKKRSKEHSKSHTPHNKEKGI